MGEVKCYNCGTLFEEDVSKKDVYPKYCGNCSKQEVHEKVKKDAESMGIKFDLKPEKGARKEWSMNKSKSNTSSFMGKYPALVFISGLLKFISIASFFIACIILFISTQGARYGQELETFLLFLPSFIFSLITSICIYAFAELITLFIDIEKNTRKSK
tara:strand:- start:109 stop:582 length:474 start_codon:yes stop_codon:yes gene_type:complete